jgi:hypothetical protein
VTAAHVVPVPHAEPGHAVAHAPVYHQVTIAGR